MSATGGCFPNRGSRDGWNASREQSLLDFQIGGSRLLHGDMVAAQFTTPLRLMRKAEVRLSQV